MLKSRKELRAGQGSVADIIRLSTTWLFVRPPATQMKPSALCERDGEHWIKPSERRLTKDLI